MTEVEWGGRVDAQWSPASPRLAATSPSALPSSSLTYGPHCWSTSAPLCTRTGMASWCWFMAARLRTGRSWLSLQLGSAPCHVGKGTNSYKSLRAVAPTCPPSSNSLTEVYCLAQEREAGSPGPVLKTELPRHCPSHPAGGAPRETALLLQETGSSHRVTDHGFRPRACKLLGFLCTFRPIFFFFFAMKISNR